VTPRATDWTLALLVAALAASGLATWFAGAPGSAWVVAAHDALGFALAAVLAVKVRRVWSRVHGVTAGLAALGLVALALASGWAWASGAELTVAGMAGLAWHVVLGAVLAVAVGTHALVRAKRPRRRDFAGRRQFLLAGAVGAVAVAAWSVQRPLQRALGWRGAERRFTGSYEAASLAGNGFPTTSWVADDPRALDAARHRVSVRGLVARPLAFGVDELDAGAELEATLDCTGGFYSTQRWRGSRLTDLVARAGPAPGATHVRVISHTGYRWGFALADAQDLLLATHVGAEPLSHGHGAPVRLVAPGRRGLEWVKWVTAIELHDGPDPGAAAATVWSSFTARGRGAA
jgi:DMSO/TMAO reductase YedYZ molybdopterin-dependent catalytic subunit